MWLTWVRPNGGSNMVTLIKEPHDQPGSYIPCTTGYTYCTLISCHLSLSLSLSLYKWITKILCALTSFIPFSRWLDFCGMNYDMITNQYDYS